jgi:hypothetical protein
MEVIKQPVEVRDPYDQDHDNQSVQDGFDLTLHGDESVYQPQQNACCDDRDEYGSQWHVVFSNLVADSICTKRQGLRPRTLIWDQAQTVSP